MKKTLSATMVAAVMATGVAMPASAEVDATVGVVSDYVFRGMGLGNAGAYVELEYSKSGFYTGTWWINDGDGMNDGLETDFWIGYGLETDGGFAFDVMLNGYEYTYTSDREWEVGVALEYAGFGFETYYGRNFVDVTGSDEDHDFAFAAVSWAGDVFGALLGHYQVVSLADETDSEAAGIFKGDSYTYLELSASGEVAGLDATVSIGRLLDRTDGDEDQSVRGSEYIVLDISKGFSF